MSGTRKRLLIAFVSSLAIYLIPRFLWPDKPVMARPGAEFNAQVQNIIDSPTKVGISVYGDGYLKLGWLGAILYPLLMGLVFGFITGKSYAQVARRDFLYLPAIFIGMRMAALGPTMWLQNAIIAPMPIYFGYLLVIWMVLDVLGPTVRTSTARRPPPMVRTPSRRIAHRQRASTLR